MWTPEKMTLVRILALRRDLAGVTAALSNARALHVADGLSSVVHSSLRVSSNSADAGEWLFALVGIEKRISSILDEFSRVSRDAGADGRGTYMGDVDPSILDPAGVVRETNELLSRDVESPVKETAGRIRALEERRERTHRLIVELRRMESLDIDLGALSSLEFIYVTLGYLPRRNLGRLIESLRDIKALIVPHAYGRDDVFIVALTRIAHRERLLAALKGAYFRAVELGPRLRGSPLDAVRQLEEELAQVEHELDMEYRRLREFAGRWEDALRDLFHRVVLNRSLLEFHSRLAGTEETSLIAGFVPSDRVGVMRSAVERAAGGRMVFDAEPVELAAGVRSNITVPTALWNPRILRPFEGLVATYGYPRYGELDPTAILALTYVAMFGFMFGDLGQGALIALLGAFLITHPPRFLRAFARAGWMVLMCGVSASLFGLLYGSVFGREGILPALWERPLGNINSFLIVGMIYGILQNVLGLALSLGNALRVRNLQEALLGEFGGLSAGFYVALLAWGYAAFVVHSAGLARAFLGAAAVFLVVLTLREPLARMLFRGKYSGDGGKDGGILPAILGTFDIVLRYLTNSISFVRLPAFAMAHVALGTAIYAIAGAAFGLPGGHMIGILLAVLGNAGVMALEGMVVGIQCLRLEFYEFFSKFLSGNGVPYKPWHLGPEEGAESS